MGDLIRDGLLLAVRRPLIVVVLPILAMVGTAWLATLVLGAGYGFEKTESATWIRADTVAAMPLIGFVWVALAWEPEHQREGDRERLRRVGAGGLAGTLLCFSYLVATELTYVGGVLLLGLLAPLVPVAVCEPGWLGRALTRSVALGRGSRWRIMVAWGVLELAIVLLGLGLLLIAELQIDRSIRMQLAYDVALRVHAGLRWGLTIAVSVAAYRRLRVSRAALDTDAWVEVFR